MSSFYDEIGGKLENDGVGIFEDDNTRDIFVGPQPPTPDDCVTVLGLPGTTLGPQRDIKELHFPRFQVIARSANYESSHDKIEEVRESLHAIIGLDLPTWHIMRCHADQDAGYIGEDAQGRHEWSINFTTEYYKIPVTP